jgi:hypothetical protein
MFRGALASVVSPVPIPDLAGLAAFFFAGTRDDDGLARPWRQGEAGFVWYSRGAFALEALAAWWTRSRAGRAPSLWLPDYFCDQATGPARQAGARLVFYPLTESLEPSWEAAERLAAGTAPDLFVLVHFFGRAADAARARAFCRRFGALLVEDAAHVMLPVPPIGAAGDFVLYSPYKTLPVPDGGLLAVRDGAALTQLRRLAADDARPPPSAWPSMGVPKRLMIGLSVTPSPETSSFPRVRLPTRWWRSSSWPGPSPTPVERPT